MKTCENCPKKHNGSYGSGRFCSLKCSRSFSTKAKRNEINEALSLKMSSKSRYVEKTCSNCSNVFKIKWSKRKQECCSRICAAKLKWKDEEYKKHISDCSKAHAINMHKTNENFGWSTRKKLKPSYPERIAINVLNELKIEFERKYKLGKYFIDFVIHEIKIAIEIDGRQHEKPERIDVDKEKDKLLNKNGWKVYRISYPKENIKERLREILTVSSIG